MLTGFHDVSIWASAILPFLSLVVFDQMDTEGASVVLLFASTGGKAFGLMVTV